MEQDENKAQQVPQQQAQQQAQQPIEVEQREILKADDSVLDETDVTNFEYLTKKVAVLQEQVELMQRILEQNNLTFKIEARANANIEDKTWQLLNVGEQ